MDRLNSFKAYDIRGKVPSELNADLAYKIGRTYPVLINAKKIVIGHDVRKSSVEISDALSKGLTDAGVDVIDIGLCGTEMVYYATPALEADGGIMITASHNPPEYNGMKFVKKGSVPVGYDSGLKDMEKMILKNEVTPKSSKPGTVSQQDVMSSFISNLKRFYDAKKIKKHKIVVNAGNGCAGLALNALEKDLPIDMIKVFNEPDSNFPNGVPNPLLIENREPTIDAIIKNKADLGVAWDGDYDRCFFFDEKGNFIEGYYIVGLLAKSILKNNPGGKIVHDPRLTWNTLEVVKKFGGQAVVSKSGHAFIKQKMREVNSVYGGEMSAHHYFRDNAYSDSGMIPFVLKYVVTQPDRPVGRKQIITPTPVKAIALKYKNIEIITDINDKKLYLNKIDIALVFAYAKIIPKELLDLPKYGFWCVHPSLLPKYRGTSPMATTLINGDKITGATIIKMDVKIDHGPIIDQQTLTVNNNDKRPEIEEKLTDLSFQMFKKIIINNDLNNLKLTTQDDNQATYTKKLLKQDGFVEFEEIKKSLNNQQLPIANSILFNLFRGLYPWPGIWTILPDGKRLKITDMELIKGKIILKKVQLEGKKEVDFKTFQKYYQLFG